MLSLALSAALPARAETRSFLFEGAVLSLDDPAGHLSGLTAIGAPFSLTSTLDSATSDQDPSESIGSYYDPQPRGDLALELGALLWRSRDLLTVVGDNLPTGNPAPMPVAYDAFRQEATFDTLADGRHWGLFIQLLFLDESAQAITSDRLPGGPPDPARFATAAQLLVTGGIVDEDGAFTLLASVTSARALPSPGAGSAALAFLALIAAAPARRRPRLTPAPSAPS